MPFASRTGGITGIILAGGEGRRMREPGAPPGGQGLDKALRPLAGKPLIAHVIERLAPQVDDIVINAKNTLEIRGKLTGVRDLVVIARSSSTPYRGTRKQPREIADELGVHYLLNGTVRVVGAGDARRVATPQHVGP